MIIKKNACVGLFVCLAAVATIGLLYPSYHQIAPIKAYVAAFPNDLVAIAVPYGTDWWNLLGRTRTLSEIDLARGSGVVSFTFHKEGRSGVINVLARALLGQEDGESQWARFRYSNAWRSVNVGDIKFDVRQETRDRSLVLSASAIEKFGESEKPFKVTLTNVSSELVTILAVQAPGVSLLGGSVAVKAGDTVTIDVIVDGEYDLVRPWLRYSTPLGEFLMPATALYKRTVGAEGK